jgi:uncharacterized protein YceK
VIRRIAVIAIASLALNGCGSISASQAMTSWVKQSDFKANAGTTLNDARHAVTALRERTSTHALLNTVCSVLFIDAGSLHASLPTPDNQSTNLVDKAVQTLGNAATECSGARTTFQRTKALAMLGVGGAQLSEATARITSLTNP